MLKEIYDLAHEEDLPVDVVWRIVLTWAVEHYIILDAVFVETAGYHWAYARNDEYGSPIVVNPCATLWDY